MKPSALPFFILFFWSNISSSQTFDKRYDLGELCSLWSIVSPDSIYLASGVYAYYDSIGNEFDIPIVVAINGSGDTLWTHKFFGAVFSVSRKIIQTRDSNFVLTTFWQMLDSSGGGSHYYDSDIFLSKFDRNGNILWQTIYSHPNDTSLAPYSICEARNGNLLVSGCQFNWTGTVLSSFIYEFDSSGNYLAHSVFSNPTDNGNISILPFKNRVYLSGTDYLLNSGADPILFCADSAFQPIWLDSLVSPGRDFGGGLDSTFDGNIIWSTCYSNYTGPVPRLAVRMIKLDTAGSVIWTYNSNVIYSSNCAMYSRPTKDSGFVWAGGLNNAYISGSNNDGYLVKLDLNGDSVWGMTFDHGSIDNFFDVQQTSDSGFVLCGESYGLVSGNLKSLAWLVKVDRWGCLVSGCNPMGIREPEDLDLVDFFPNPFQDYITFLNRKQPRTIGNKEILQIYDLTGREIYCYNLLESKSTINLSSLRKGCYIAVLLTEKNKFVRKLIKSN